MLDYYKLKINKAEDLKDLDYPDLMDLWNEYCEEHEKGRLTIHRLRPEYLDDFAKDFGGAELARAIYFGSYDFWDAFIRIDKQGNFDTFSGIYDMHERIDFDVLFDFFKEGIENGTL